MSIVVKRLVFNENFIIGDETSLVWVLVWEGGRRGVCEGGIVAS